MDTPTVVTSASDAPRFVPRPGVETTRVVELLFPVEHQGKIYDSITIRRPIMREWRAYLRATDEAAKQGGPAAADLIDQPWLSAPAVVLEGLEFTDAARIEVEQERFFGVSTLPSVTETDATDE